jgi:hypothetical protein
MVCCLWDGLARCDITPEVSCGSLAIGGNGTCLGMSNFFFLIPELMPAIPTCGPASSAPSYPFMVTRHDLQSIRYSRHHPNSHENLRQDYHGPLPHLVHRSMVRTPALSDPNIAFSPIYNLRPAHGSAIRSGSHGTSFSIIQAEE